jgi:putative ABC transport system ATP-binding protein
MRIMELIQKLNRERGTSIVVVTHDSRIFPYAHRIAHMDDGHITELRNNR